MRTGVFQVFSYIVLIMYIVFSMGNFYMNYKNRETEMGFFKIFLMPLLAIYYVITFKKISILLLIAILFSWFGDIFLIKTKRKNIILGIASFGISHILYIFLMARLVKFLQLNYLLTILALVVYVGITLIVNTFLEDYSNKKMNIDKKWMYFYGVVLALLNTFAIMIASEKFNTGSFYLILGANLFMISDFILSLTLFLRKNRFASVIVMLTYTIAQILIVSGIANLMI